MYQDSQAAAVPATKRSVLIALGRHLRRAYDEVLSEPFPLEIERAFEHLSDFAPKSGSLPHRNG